MSPADELKLSQLKLKNIEDLSFSEGVDLQILINRKKTEDKREVNIRKNDAAVYDSLIKGEGI